jgi:hypothetical protein
MNQANLAKLFHNYIESYNVLTDKEHDELYKWRAVNHFQRHWNLETENFGEMFEQAMGQSFNLINNSIVQPTSGIVFLCKQNKETEEEVREEFRKLLAPDDGDIKVRQERIDAFAAAINEKLQKVAPGKWKYDQDRRSVIMYLAFIAPDDNYMFKSTEAKAFANGCEFGEDSGSGQTFRLDVYYRMCKELAEEIKKNEKLCALLEEKLQGEANADEDETNPITELAGRYNIYAYDIIYCANAYNLYGNIPVRKKAKLSSIEQKKLDREKRIQELAAQRDETNEQLEQIEQQIDENRIPDLAGMTVKNIRYGAGTVAEQNGKYLTVEFPSGAKKFVLPDAVAKGFLKIEDADTMRSFGKIGSLTEMKEKYTREIEMLTTEISRLSQIK